MATGKDRKRLTDMHVVEVSAVDRAANKRKFLVVKGEDGVAKVSEKAGAAVVVKDGKHVAEKKDDAVLKLGKAEKEALLARVGVALAECAALKDTLEKAEEADGAEVPAGVLDKLASVSEGLLGKEGDVAHVAKGRKQFSAQRLTQLRTAHTQLGQLLDEVGGVGAEEGGDGAADTAAELAAGMGDVTKSFEGFKNDLSAFREQFGAVVEQVVKAVKATSDRVAVVEKARQLPNAAPADAGTERVRTTEKKKKGSLGQWGVDLNRERQGA